MLCTLDKVWLCTCCFSVIDWNVFEMTEKKFSHFGQNIWKYRLINTVKVSSTTTVSQTTEMFQWPICLSKKWPKSLSEKKQICALFIKLISMDAVVHQCKLQCGPFGKLEIIFCYILEKWHMLCKHSQLMNNPFWIQVFLDSLMVCRLLVSKLLHKVFWCGNLLKRKEKGFQLFSL